MKEIQLKVKEMLEKRGITQRDFAVMSGIAYGTVGKMCTNKADRPPLENLAICCELLKCELEDILEMVDIPGTREYKTKIVPRYNHHGERIDLEE